MAAAVRAVATVALLWAVMAKPLAAHDSLAPIDAPHHWLPDEPWVHRHWIPFDERDLKRALGLKGRALEGYLYDDHRTLAQLAALRGIPIEPLLDHLLAPWGDSFDETAPARRDHALRILTQGHLAQHAFFHVFHLDFDRQNGAALFGLAPDQYWLLRKQGLTPDEIARLGGVPPEQARDGMIRMLRRARDEGVQQRLALPAQADRIFVRQLSALPCWMSSPLGTRDWGNPYGKNKFLHHHHDRDWPATSAERRAGERQVERVRRKIRQSCWRRPPRWNWAAHGLPAP